MEDKIICGCYKVKKSEIVEAIKNGADTVEKVGEVTKAGTGCGNCKGAIQEIINEVETDRIVCGCYKVKKGEIVEAIKNGANTVEKVGKATKAGTGCGRCKGNIQKIIDEVNGISKKEEKGFFARLLKKLK